VECTKKAPEPPPPPPPSVQQPTAEQITDEMRSSLAEVTPLLDTGGAVPQALADKALAGLRTAKDKHQAGENGKKALTHMAVELEEQLRRSGEAELWHKAVFLCDALDALDPGNVRVQRYRDKAKVQLNRPVVRVKSFFEDKATGQTTIFLDVYIPESGKTESVAAREGEEFLGLKFLNIVGNQSGVRFEYLATGDVFEEKGP
jgi:hypothetical protein